MKEISAVLDATPVLLPVQFKFGNGWPIIIFVRKEMFTRLRYLPG